MSRESLKQANRTAVPLESRRPTAMPLAASRLDDVMTAGRIGFMVWDMLDGAEDIDGIVAAVASQFHMTTGEATLEVTGFVSLFGEAEIETLTR